ncbi:MAG: hypothetical protein WD794_11685 [Mycobacteriales bacterium]
MSEAVRGLVLLVSVLLWLPVLPPLLAGELSTAEAGLRYAAALLLAWGGGSLLSALVRNYAREPVEEDAGSAGGTDGAEVRRRQEDAGS